MKALLLVPLTGCYFWYPHDLAIMPALKAGADARIEIVDTPKTWYSHDCETRSEHCVWHDGQLSRPHVYISSEARFDGKRITNGELKTLVEPVRQKQAYAEMESYKGTCNLSLVPSGIFAVGALGDLAGAAIGDNKVGDALLIGGAIAMVVGAALSYPMGGYACVHAKEKAQDLGIANDNVYGWDLEANASDRAIARDATIRQAVDAFNSGAHPTTEVAVTPPASEATTGALRDAMVASGQFTTFLALADHAGVDLVGVIFAPTDAAFAATAGFALDKALALQPNLLRQQLRGLMDQVVEPLDAIVARGGLVTLADTHLKVKKRGGTILVDGFPIAGAPIEADGFAAYPLGPK